jgi:hypothetical protein
MKTFTIGTAKPRAMVGPRRVLKERTVALFALLKVIFWIKSVIIAATKNKNPGRKIGWKLVEMEV